MDERDKGTDFHREEELLNDEIKALLLIIEERQRSEKIKKFSDIILFRLTK